MSSKILSLQAWNPYGLRGGIILLMLMLPIVLVGQDSTAFTRKYAVETLQHDLDVLNATMRKCHPKYYAFTSKPEMDAHYENLKARINEPLDEFHFRVFVREAMAKVGCGHIGISASKPYEKALANVKRSLLPLEVWILEERIYVRRFLGEGQQLHPGVEILGINGKSSKSILDEMKSVAVTDGLNETHKIRSIERSFAAYHAILNGFFAEYEIEYVDPVGDPIVASVKSAPSEKFNELSENQTKWLFTSESTRFKVDSLEPSLGILDIDNFSGKRQKQVFRASFREIRKRKLSHLAIDLRGNPGGNAYRGNNLLRYLLKGPIIRMVFYHRMRPTLFARYTHASFMDRLTPFLFATNPIQYPRKGGWAHEFWFLSKWRNRFRGNVFVLTDGGTFSMASYVTTYLKHKANAMVIGEETGGGEIGSNGMASLTIKLPGSGIRVGINTFHVHHAVRTDNKDHGVVPDFPMEPSVEDKLQGRDPVIEKVRDLVH